MKVIIIGADGQLGRSLNKIKHKFDCDTEFLNEDMLDITHEEEIEDYLCKSGGDVLINCAAYTAVDKAEEEYDKAYMINSRAVGWLAKYTRKYNLKFIHISTDYVFDGTCNVPYNENHLTNPVSAYGKTKLSGEKQALENNEETKIIRTSWLYSEFMANFVKTMIRLGAEKSFVNVVFDQVGTPTFATDLAEIIVKFVKTMPDGNIFHFSNEGVCSWYDFAKKIMEMTGSECRVIPVLSKDYPSAVKRPNYSVLDKEKIKQELDCNIRHWEDALRECIDIIKQGK